MNDTELVSVFINNVLVRFSGIFFEALPWVILGSVLAGIVQELPTRRSPIFMVPLGVLILVLTLSPYELFLQSRDYAGPALKYDVPIALVLALISGWLMFVGQAGTDSALRLFGRKRGLAIVGSSLLGLILPMCECGIITVMRRLYRKGMPLSCCAAYILAGPVVNTVVLLTTYVAFKTQTAEVKGLDMVFMTAGQLVVMRGLLALVVAVGTAFLVEWMVRSSSRPLLTESFESGGLPLIEADEAEQRSRSLYQRLSNITETALHDVLDVTFYLVVGGLFAAGVREWMEATPQYKQIMSGVLDNPATAIGWMMLLSFIVTLCSEADAFVAFSFTSISSAAKLAFMVYGPMFDVKLFFMYTRVFRPRLMAAIILAVTAQVFVWSYVIHIVWTRMTSS